MADLQAQIQSLLAQLQQLQAQLAQMQGQPATWCHDFNVNLKIGDSGSEVASLIEALEREGFKITMEVGPSSVFDESVASAVTGFQEKYKDEILTPLGLKYGTGYAGASTRKKLNSLYGCGVIPTPTPTPIPTPTCNNLWWFDNATTICQQKTFCGAYMYYGLRTFSTLQQCQAALLPTPTPTPTPTLTPTVEIKVGESDKYGRSIFVDWASTNAGYCRGAGIGWKGSNYGTWGSVNLPTPGTEFFAFSNNLGFVGTISFFVQCFSVDGTKSAYDSKNITIASTQTPSITVLSPNGGESWQIGKTYTISWTNTTGKEVGLDLLKGGVSVGLKGNFPRGNYSASQSSYSWTIDSSTVPGDDYKIVVQTYDGTILDSSDAPFSIAAATIANLAISAPIQPTPTLAFQNAQNVPFTKISLSAGNSDVTVSGIDIQRTGVANDAVFSGVVLLDENGQQIGVIKTLDSVHRATIGDIFIIKTGQSRTLTVAGNMASNLASYAGQVAYLSITGIRTTATVTGTFPITGAGHIINFSYAIGSFSVSLDPSSPSAKTVAAGSTNVTATVLKFSAVNESVALQQIALQFDGSNLSAITKYTIWDGATKVGEGLFIGTSKTSTSVFPSQVIIPKDGYKILTIKVDLAQVGTGQPARIGDTVAINYDGNNYQNTKGVGQSSGAIISSSTKIDTAASKITLGALTVVQSPQLNQMANSLESEKTILNQLIESLKNL